MRKHLTEERAEIRMARLRSARADADHPLLRLQRTAGNQAVTAVVQRDKGAKPTEEESATWFPSKVALAIPALNFKGKTNATFDSVTVERHWEWGLLADDLAIVFQCGPQRFRFESSRTGGKNFPWGILNHKGGVGGWVEGPIQDALETLYSHWKDPKRFGPATRVVIDALQHDVEMFRTKEAEFRAKQKANAAGSSWWRKH